MVQSRLVEIWVGVFVAAGLAALFVLAMKVSNLTTFKDENGYLITARFDNIGGLKERAQVTMAGVRIGRVEAIDFDDKRYEAKVTLKINGRYNHLPRDTTASIYTAGLLGEQYVSLEPGAESEYLKPNDEVTLTQSAMVLEDLIGRFLYNKAAEGAPEGGTK